MTALTHRSTLRGPANGGVAARRAVVRWAWRMFHREWRRQLLVIALLTVAVAAAIGSVTIAYNSAAADNAEFGSANHLIRFDGANPEELDAGLAAARERFGTTDVIGQRTLEVPGSVDPVEFRSQDPRGPYGDARLALHRGSYPEGPGHVAVTDGVATLLGLEIGDPLSLDGRRRDVVGIVENPLDLSDEFALVTPSSAEAPDEVSVLVDAGAGSVDAFVQSPAGANERSAFRGTEERQDDQEASALAMFSVATVFLLLASLVASAGFAVIAQRRLRQLGALAAIGATEKHVRLVLVTGGTVVGVIGALIGAIVGLALWLAIIPTLEPAVGHRIDPLSLPWTLLVAVVFVAVLGATPAAWWPARAVARIPVTLALSARPPKPRPTHHSTLVAAGLIAAGIVSLALSGRDREPLIVIGIMATILGTLLLAPLAIRLFARVARHVPIAPRLALRDLARYQARSGAALAAITLALGIAAAVVIVAEAEERQSAAKAPNLSDRQIRVYTGATFGPELVAIRTPPELERMAVGVRQLATGLPRTRPRLSRPEHGLPGRPVRPDRRAGHRRGAAEAAGRRRPEGDRTRRDERPEDRQPEALRLSGGGHRPRADLVRDARRPSPSGLETDPVRLARRVQPAFDERADLRCPRALGRRRPDDRDAAREHLTGGADRDRDRRRRLACARHPGHDRRADPR